MLLFPPKRLYFFYEYQFNSQLTVQTHIKYLIMRHFIRVFTVCQSTHLRVYGLQKVNSYEQDIFNIYFPQKVGDIGM